MKKLLMEFKAFALKGNVIDLAIGVIIGSAFSKIVSSLVNDLVTPLLALILGQAKKFSDLKIPLGESSDGVKNSLNYGNFIQTIIDFLIVAFSIFVAVKGINELKKRFEKQKDCEPAAPPAPTKTELLLEEIRDLMKKDK